MDYGEYIVGDIVVNIDDYNKLYSIYILHVVILTYKHILTIL